MTTRIEQLEDSTVKITVSDGTNCECGWVSSYHLVEPKVNQLMEVLTNAKKY